MNSSRSYGSRRPPRGGGFRHPRPQRRAFTGKFIHHSKFVNKATEPAEEVAFVPQHTFADFEIDARIKANITKKGYVTPSPIQDGAIPHILAGRDVVGLANTGTGKTGAFLIPLLDKVVKDRTQKVLIMAPTRELAVQIDDEYRGFSQGSGFNSVCAVGGMSISNQIRALRANPYFVIGTPGRLKDLMDRGVLDISKFKTVVLDEADRMLDMGFVHDMRFIMSLMPKDRHTLFFSATLAPEIEKLIHEFLKDEVRIMVKTRDTSKNVEQDIVRVPPGMEKLDHLRDLLIQPEFRKVLIFGRTKHGVEKLSSNLQQFGFKSESIHGNKSHSQRVRALDAFKQERVSILVATDVAARGLDIPKVSHVINYDQPDTYEEYVHRIGRTGRAGERGKALTFVSDR